MYPPKEDTNLLAKRLVKLGSGNGKKCLEIGTGSGILSLLCRRQGWQVEACDINPIAVASAREMFRQNDSEDIQVFEGGPGPQEDGEITQWAKQKNYDLIFWNLPYLEVDEDAEFPQRRGLCPTRLGPSRCCDLFNRLHRHRERLPESDAAG